MSKHLTDLEIHKVVEVLQGWKSKLTWDLLVNKCEKSFGRKPSRQTLARAARVDIAYKEAKQRLRDQQSGEQYPLRAMSVLDERIARLQIENGQLRRENQQLLEQFVVWQYNAAVAGISSARLNSPLPPVDLQPTKTERR